MKRLIKAFKMIGISFIIFLGTTALAILYLFCGNEITRKVCFKLNIRTHKKL